MSQICKMVQGQQKVKVHNKTFRLYLPEKQIREKIREIAAQIDGDLHGKEPLFMAILNGSFFFAADLLRELSFISEITFVKIASYHGTSSTGQVRNLIGVDEQVKGRHVVILEDIVDSGLTMKYLVAELEHKGAASIRIATLLLKPDALKEPIHPHYVCFSVPNDFLIGYGLDYDKMGRNLRDIYVLDAE